MSELCRAPRVTCAVNQEDLCVGSKGGRYYLSRNGKKVYCKGEPKPAPPKAAQQLRQRPERASGSSPMQSVSYARAPHEQTSYEKKKKDRMFLEDYMLIGDRTPLALRFVILEFAERHKDVRVCTDCTIDNCEMTLVVNVTPDGYTTCRFHTKTNMKQIWKKFEGCKNHRFAFFLLITTGHLGHIGDDGESYSHANALVVDFAKQLLICFDPNGGPYGVNTYNQHVVDQFIWDHIMNAPENKRHEYVKTYVPPLEVCPLAGPQIYENSNLEFQTFARSEGYCTYFSVWFMEMVIRNPTKEPRKIVEHMMRNADTPRISTKIRLYIARLMDYLIKHAGSLEEGLRRIEMPDDEIIHRIRGPGTRKPQQDRSASPLSVQYAEAPQNITKAYEKRIQLRTFWSKHLSSFADNVLALKFMLSAFAEKYKGDVAICTDCTEDNCVIRLMVEVSPAGLTTCRLSPETDMKHVWKKLEGCKGYRFAFFVVHMDVTVSYGERSWVASALIVDYNNRKLIRFTPQGGDSYRLVYGQHAVDDCIDELIMDAPENKYVERYVPPLEMCPVPGPRFYENTDLEFKAFAESTGYCFYFSVWFMELVIRNPDKSPKRIVETMLKNRNKANVSTKIRLYVARMMDYMNKYRRYINKELHRVGRPNASISRLIAFIDRRAKSAANQTTTASPKQ